MTVPLTVVILTLNEERNLDRALRSVAGWAGQVCVVDSGSKDRTVEISRSYRDVYLVQHEFEDYGKQWNWALDNLPIETEWVMKLDADEAVLPELRGEIEAALASVPPDVAAFAVWRKFIFMGKWLARTVGRRYDVRLWRCGAARFEDRTVNEHLVVDGRVVRLKAPLLHEDRKGISVWVWRHNRYSTMEALEYLRKAVSRPTRISEKSIARQRFLKEKLWPWVPCKPLAYFVYLMVFKLGFLDGRAGWTYAGLRSFYYYLIEVKKREGKLAGEASSPDLMS